MSQSLILALIFGLSSVGWAQTTVKPVPAHPTTAIDGKVLYREYCAACHGADGKGAGPAAVALKKAPTDLTHIARANNGSFPEERMLRILQGEDSVTAHGSGAMPVWGTVFNNMSPSIEMAQLRVHALLSYLEKIQVK
ncbi:MAG TPA: cytochrome c [Bryobacteraceae bacterium]|nr:cytochrome c [Bryobacteraceae bacterium]